MTDADDDVLSGLPDGVRRLLAAPPVTDKKLLELSVTWTGLQRDEARMVDVLRLFIITWDPLEQLAARPDGFAIVNADLAGLELVVYVPVWSLVESAAARGVTVAEVLAEMTGSAVVTASAHGHEVAAALASHQAGPDLLSDRAAGSALGTPDIALVSADWEAIGLGAITDIVQHAFGPVDLDRSMVELAAAKGSRSDCPACAGRRFGFPGELAKSQSAMCPDHRDEAEAVIRARMDEADASNPDGWGALADACDRLELPHLPNGLATRLAGAEEATYVDLEPDELAARARLIVEAASWFPGRRDDFAIALSGEPDLAGQLPDWVVGLVLDLGRARLGEDAVLVGDALARVDPEMEAFLDGDVAVALAQAGLAEAARARIEANLARWPNDFWIRLHAGDALVDLGDLDGATAHFNVALSMADETDDFEARSYALERLNLPGRRSPKQQHGRPTGRRKGGRNRSRRKRRK